MIPWPQILTLLGMGLAQGALVMFYKSQQKMAPPPEHRMKMRFEVWFAVLFCLVIATIACFYYPVHSPLGSTGTMILGLSLPSLIYAVFLSLSGLVRRISDCFFRNEENQHWFAGHSYVLQKNASHIENWVLKPSLLPYVKALSILSQVLLWVTMTILLLVQQNLFHQGFASFWSGDLRSLLTLAPFPLAYTVPVCSLMIARTWMLYLGGALGKTAQDTVEKGVFRSERQSNYAAAAAHLKKTFAGALLLDEAPREVLSLSGSPDEVLSRLERSPKISDRAVAAHFRARCHAQQVDPDYIRMSADLCAGRNVLLRNPFFQDLGPYLAYPLEQGLERKHKVLVLCSGHESVDFVSRWLASVFNENTLFEEKWKIRPLEDLVPECEIGLLRYSRLCDPDVLEKNRAFFEQTEYVVLLNPSQILTTLQMPLNVLCGILKTGPVAPVFCIVDRNLSQIKDTLSHVIKSPIHADYTIACQAPHQKLMIWDAEADFGTMERFEKQTSYLGGGIELGAEAVSMQIPSSTWVSETSLPVVDLQNAAALGYPAICQVMKIGASQSALREKLPVSAALFELKQEEAAFLVVEDEYNNPFTMANSYGTRARREVFLNVLSENYLLRDYFCANAQIFRTNERSVPGLVPSFAKTHRNLLLKLILQLLVRPMDEAELQVELDLAGLDETSPLARQLSLHSGSPIEMLLALLEHYTRADPSLFRIEKTRRISVASKPEIVTSVRIDPDRFELDFGSTLKNVSYVLEDEALDHHILDSRLYSLVLQSLLPGQSVSYGGQNYRVKRISPAHGVVLQRASDQIDSRKTYRQIRRYALLDLAALDPLKNITVNGFCFLRYEADFSVETPGYLEMNQRSNLEQAIVHDLSQDPSTASFRRHYHNKDLLLIRFPQTGQAVLYQIALLLQEMMPTVLPFGAPYLSICARKPDTFSADFLSIVPEVSGLEEGVLAVIEDSDLDLGLLDCFEQSFFELLEVLQDYLQWNEDRLNPNDEEEMDFDVDPDEIRHYESLKKSEPEPDEWEELKKGPDPSVELQKESLEAAYEKNGENQEEKAFDPDGLKADSVLKKNQTEKVAEAAASSSSLKENQDTRPVPAEKKKPVLSSEDAGDDNKTGHNNKETTQESRGEPS